MKNLPVVNHKKPPAEKLRTLFTGVVLAGLALCILFLLINGLTDYSDAQFLTASVSKPVRAALCVTMALFLFLFFGALWHILKRCSDRMLGIIFAVVSVGAFLLQSFFLFYFRSAYLFDSAFVSGAGSSLAAAGAVSEDALYYMSVYPNQNMFAVLTMLLWKLGSLLSVRAGNIPLLCNFLNLLCIDVTVVLIFLTLRIWKEKISRAEWTFLLIVTVCHPFWYIGVSYYYTITLAMPFLAAVLLFAVRRIKKPERFRWYHALICGFLFAAGYLLRATTIIPMIAVIVCLLLFCRFNRKDVLVLLTAVLCIVGIGQLNKSVVGIDTTDTAFPTAHWLMMSLTSPGNHNEEDEAYTASFATKEEKMAAVRERYFEKIQKLGAKGLAELVPAKIKNTWGSGANGYPLYLENCLRTGMGYTYIFGSHRDFVILYHQGYYLLQLIIIFLMLAADIRSGNRSAFLFQLTLLGAILFYILWETGAQYSLPFLPVLMLLTADGADRMLQRKATDLRQVSDEARQKVLLIAALCAITFLAVFFVRKATVFTEQIQTFTEPVVTQILADYELEVGDGEELVQTFTPQKSFNQLIFQFRNDDDKSDAVYEVMLSGDKTGTVFLETITAAGQPHDGAGVYAFDAVEPAAGETFRLTIKKTAGSPENNLRFVTYKMGQYDAYPNGSCTLGGQKLEQDMLLSVSFVSETSYTTIKRYTVFAIGIILLYTVTTIIFLTEEKRCRRFL